MKDLTRFGVSMENDLLEKFDLLIARRGYTNRSEAIRDLVREKLVDESVQKATTTTFGIISYVYDHHQRELDATLTEFQHHNLKRIVSSTHVHIDHDTCLESVIMKGKASELKKIADKILSFKGVKHGKLILTSAFT
ncbi:MAG TPA: nickel-responsive transcriptional regulator NikR [Bacteroidota bacterium]|nr:nickel-responsive transcriptional regulator NikR [Bacteroidota bacterium]